MSTLEPKAKRTHARRSCELCKVRKTRCELPDIDVPSTSDPLAIDKACHRCRVLALPCVVDDVARKPSKRRQAAAERDAAAALAMVDEGLGVEGIVSTAGAPRPKPVPSRARGKARDSSDGINHSLEVMQGIHPELEWTGLNGEPALYSSDPFLKSSPSSSIFGAAGPPTNVMKLHGRPLELACAMLRVAYAKSEIKDGVQGLTYDPIDWNTVVDGHLRGRLETGFAQLRTFHPYLDPLPTFFDRCAMSGSLEDQLLLCVIVYLCTLPLVPEPPIAKLRLYLRPRISFLRNRVLIQAPRSFTTIQALELLGVHAPLGVVPLQLADPRSISVARGQLALLQATSSHLNFHGLFGAMVTREAEMVWQSPDCLLFLSVTALEASMALEDEVPRAPAALKDARYLVSSYLDESREFLWRNATETTTPASLIGRLGVMDRICRLGEVLDTLDRLRRALDNAAMDAAFNPVDAIAEEFTSFAQRMDRCDTRHEAIMSIVSPVPQYPERGYVTHRALRRRYEHVKVLGCGLRYLLATPYIPGTRMALPGVPTDIPPHQRVAYAIGRATNPADIMPVLTQNSPATMVIWQYGAHRGEISQQILNGLADLEMHVIPRSNAAAAPVGTLANLDSALSQPPLTAELVPLHECIAFAVDSAKMLMEMRAGTLLLHKRSGNLHEATLAPIWVNSLKRACHTLRLIGLLSPPSTSGGSAASEKGPGEGETMANGCSNILGSMLRMTEEWGRSSLADLETDDGVGLAMKGGFGAGGFAPMHSQQAQSQSQGQGQGSYDGERRYLEQIKTERRDLPHDFSHSHGGIPLVQSHSGDMGQNNGNGNGNGNGHLHAHPTHPPNAHSQAYPGPAPYPPPNGPQHHPPSGEQQHTYMDSSDRWMASGGGGGGSGSGPGTGSGPSDGTPGQGVHNPYLPDGSGASGAGYEPHGDHSHASNNMQHHAHPQGQQPHPHPHSQQFDSGAHPHDPQHMQSAPLGPGHGQPQHAQGQGQGQGQGHGQGSYAPTALDLLLSQMFHYGPPQQ